MQDCIFCKIAGGEIPADKVYEDDQVVAFRDLNPQAPTHILVIPRKHIATLNDLQTDDEALMGRIYGAAREIASLPPRLRALEPATPRYPVEPSSALREYARSVQERVR